MKPKYIIQLTVITFLHILVSVSFMQGQDIEIKIADMMENARNHGFIELDETIVSDGIPQEILNALSKYRKDSLEQIRHTTMILEYQTAQKYLSDSNIVMEVVERLANYCLDKEPQVWQQAARLLLNFSEIDFSTKATETIKFALKRSELSNEIILIAGIVGHKNEIEKMKNKYQNEMPDSSKLWYGKFVWACQLALARMGDETAISEVINKVNTESEPILKITRLLKDIDYIRQPEGVEIIKEVLISNDRLPPLKAGKPGTKCAHYAMDLLANSIEDFPVKSKGCGYSKAELEKARKWVDGKTKYRIEK